MIWLLTIAFFAALFWGWLGHVNTGLARLDADHQRARAKYWFERGLEAIRHNVTREEWLTETATTDDSPPPR